MSTKPTSYRASIYNLSGEFLNSRNQLEELIRMLHTNIEDFLTSTKMYLKANDRFSIVRAGNKLKNLLSMIEAYGLLDYLDVIERECQHLDTLNYVEKLLEDFKNEYLLVHSDLNRQINKIHG
ncbi:hypothetical protein [Robertkochia aurantiaca]|uniref:hypothetical protein n=1 Tax=Robertkochia aurantiaca TaxID=2873700 RepID=UPI001CC9BC2F|nr:hypothetical protein [Robertkochia sp. 3YJGBD-33]